MDCNSYQQDSVMSGTISSHYVDIPVITSSRPQNGVYDCLAPATPNCFVKQSDNPLYSSAQELRIGSNYDIVPSRSHSRISTTSDIQMSDNTRGNIVSNRLSYGLELELSNRAIPPIHHKRSRSQGGVDPMYTEL